MNGFEKRAHAKRQAILDAAKDVFIQRGISDVTVEEIAGIARVSKVTIFKYFGDKKNLAREVLLPFVDEWIGFYEELAASDISFLEKIEKIIRHKDIMREAVGNSLWREIVLKDKAMHRIIMDLLVTRQYQIYIQLIRSGKENGDIDVNMPDKAILMYIRAFLSLYDTEDFSEENDEVHSGLMKMFFKGLVNKPFNL